MSFMSQLAAGAIKDDAIDDHIDAWHTSVHDNGKLHEYLGLTWAEYARWVEKKVTPSQILEARMFGPRSSQWPRPWRTWKKGQNYQKTEYDVLLPNGTIHERCWPNAGKLNAMDGSGKKWSEGVQYRRSANPRMSAVPLCFTHLLERPKSKPFVPSADKPNQPFEYEIGDMVVATQFPEEGVFEIDRRSRHVISGKPFYYGKSPRTPIRMKRMTEEFLRRAKPEECIPSPTSPTDDSSAQ